MRAARTALTSAPASSTVEGIAVSSTNALVLLDEVGRPVRPAIMQLDGRAASDAADVQYRLGRMIARATGNRATESGYWLPVLRWLHAHEPGSLDRAHTLVYPNGYVVLQLTGARTIDRTRAATTMLFDQKTRVWSDTLVLDAGLRPCQLPPVVECADAVGSLHHEAADALGLPDGIPVAGGAMDSVTGALGMRLLDPGDSAVMLGTVARVGILGRTPKPDQTIVGCPYPQGELWWSMSALWGAGGWLQWLVDSFYLGEWDAVRLPERPQELDSVVVVCPSGRRGGAIFGLRAGQALADVGRAGVVGVLAELADGLDGIARTVRQPTTRVAVCGRGARLAAPVLANLLGTNVEIPVDPEAETRGGAVLAACAARLVPDLATAAELMVPAHESCRPEADWAEYRAIFGTAVVPPSKRCPQQSQRGAEDMAGLTPWHLVLLLAIVLIVLGPGKLPETGAAIGKSLRSFRDAMNEPSGPASPSSSPDSTPQTPPSK